VPIYGDHLAFFGEQFRQVDYFHMAPKPKASYTERDSIERVTGVFQYVKKGELTREHDTLADVNVPVFWTRRKLNVGDWFIQKDDELYRIVNPSDWSFEGGFQAYILESFVGNSDVQEPFEYVDIGQDSYD
jgi:hypothetical protein